MLELIQENNVIIGIIIGIITLFITMRQITTVQRNYPIGSVDLNRNHSSDVLV